MKRYSSHDSTLLFCSTFISCLYIRKSFHSGWWKHKLLLWRLFHLFLSGCSVPGLHGFLSHMLRSVLNQDLRVPLWISRTLYLCGYLFSDNLLRVFSCSGLSPRQRICLDSSSLHSLFVPVSWDTCLSFFFQGLLFCIDCYLMFENQVYHIFFSIFSFQGWRANSISIISSKMEEEIFFSGILSCWFLAILSVLWCF